MAKTYSDALKQIKALQAEAEKLRRKEIAGIVSQIHELVQAYGLTAADLGLGPRTAKPNGVKPSKVGKRSKSKSQGVRFRDGDGNTWGGRGPRPQWLRNALKAGKELADFAV